MAARPCYLQFDNIGKDFPGCTALDSVSFGIPEGCVHALVGENGAGKSTLLKILSGAQPPSRGTVRIAGRACPFRGAADAFRAGVAVIYQELHLVPGLSVAENIFLGSLPRRRGGLVDRRRLHDRARALLATLGEELPPGAELGRLPIAQRQMVEIAKALSRGAKILAFDEPTSSLSARETERLFAVIKDLRAQGNVILYVTHRLEEIFHLCDAATVLRDGRLVATYDDLRNVDSGTLISRMVGRELKDVYGYRPRPRGAPLLEVNGLTGRGIPEPVSFTVSAGEILGIFGLVGAGRTELLKLIYGAARVRSGSVRVGGHGGRIVSPRHAITRGLALCPEDRKKEGIIPLLTLRDNINLSAGRARAWGGILITRAWEAANARERIAQLSIKATSPLQKIGTLSGGNQQKAILGRWLSEDVGVLLLDEPTRSIDVGAKREIYDIIYALTARGKAVVMVSSDLPETLGVCDRIMVMRGGRVTGLLERGTATAEQALKLALPLETRSVA